MERLSKRTGKTPGEVVEEAIDLYEVYFTTEDPSISDEEKAERILANPISRKIFSARQSALNQVSAQKISEKDRYKRASKAGTARAKKLGPDARKKIATEAAKARWGKPKEP